MSLKLKRSKGKLKSVKWVKWPSYTFDFKTPLISEGILEPG
jgi:hypothetical protein